MQHSAAIDCNLILAVVSVALADHHRVFFPPHGESNRALHGLRCNRRRSRDEARLLSLSAKSAADGIDMNLHLVVMDAERHGRGLMHLHRTLGGWMNYE